MNLSTRSEEILENTRVNQRNMLAYERLTAKHVNEVDVLQENGIQATMSPLKLPLMNDVTAVNMNEEIMEETILRFTDIYLARNIRPRWRVWDMDASDHVKDYLEALNYKKSGYQTAMSMDLESWMVVSTEPAELNVRKVDDETTCLHYASVLAQSLNIPDHAMTGFQEFVAKVGCDDSSPLHHYVAYEKCEPVSILTLFYSEESVGIYNIETVQKRGKSRSHLIIHALKDAQKNGAKKAVLQTADKSVQVYERLGFHNDGNILEYRMA